MFHFAVPFRLVQRAFPEKRNSGLHTELEMGHVSVGYQEGIQDVLPFHAGLRSGK